MDPGPVKIYSTKDVPRLRYITGIILGDILGLSWEIITDRRKLGKHPVINYSGENIPGSFRILPDSLLFEQGISSREISLGTWSGLPVFFRSSGESDLPFDIFAASFWLVSRYEEYLDHQPDENGRFRASSSLAFRGGFLDLPLVDMWVKEFSRAFLRKYRNLVFKRNEFRAMLTVDIDQPYAYLAKGLLRSIGGLLNDLKSNSRRVSHRYHTVTQLEKDPFDVYDYITEHIEKHKADVRFFFPVGDYSRFDKNPSWKNPEYRQLITTISSKYKTGLHPSYFSCGIDGMIGAEKERLETILGRNVSCSRFHYIRLSLPESYRKILNEGITEDYSMGYPEEPGFRAGIARPFYFYDLLEERQTPLRIFPFQIMDGTLFQYKKYDCTAALESVVKMIDSTRKSGGLFISIWHNTSLIDNEEWRGWREIFEIMLKSQANESLS